MNTDKDPLFMMESRLSPSPMHWDHELRMCKCLEINRGVFRFMESFSLKQPTSRKRLILSREIRIHPCSSVVTTLHDSGFSVKGARRLGLAITPISGRTISGKTIQEPESRLPLKLGPRGLSSFGFRIFAGVFLLAVTATGPAASPSLPQPPPSPTPVSARDFFNVGVQQLRARKLREAEASLETALASQSERLQNPALYNLGHVRFDEGIEELKKGPAAKPTAARGRTAAQLADQAVQAAADALASNDVQKMVAAYMRGRGIRKELKAATKAVHNALQTYGGALNKWERSAGDFKSATELNPADADAQQNADVVERSIAKLVDSLRELQRTAGAMGDKNRELGEKLKQLKGRIPAPDMPPGAAGDEEEEEDFPNGPQPDQKEGASREGEEMKLSPEQAAWLLQGFSLDSERRLPMGQKDTAEPKERSRRPW